MTNEAKVLTLSADEKRVVLPRWVFYTLAAVLPLLLPLVLNSNYSLAMMSQMGISVIAALSYNMLLGQCGLLSFGPAVYSGLGGYATIFILAQAGSGKLPFPVTLMPLVGGVAGLCVALLLGYVTTKRAGIAFSMITLGVAELVGAAVLVLPGFGGEGGLSGNRTTGTGWFGIDYGSATQVFYLIAGWVIVSIVLMYGITRTPLGRLANATRDNNERVQFVGYNPQRVRYMMFVMAAFFAGIAGGLAALNYEIVSHEYVGHHASSAPLLMAYIGGCGYFFGPILGAVVITLLEVVVGAYTKAWPLYMGGIFIATVLFAPSGLAGIVMMHRQVWQAGLFRRLVPCYLKGLAPTLLMTAGVVCLVESVYRVMGDDGVKVMKPLGITIDAGTPTPWIAAAVVTLAGVVWLRRVRSGITQVWEELNSELQGRQPR